MVEIRKEIERAQRADDETSGVHLALRPGWGALGEELARRLTEELGARVLRRFPRLSREDRATVLAAASARLLASGPPQGPIEAHVRRAVFCEAREIDLTRFAEELRAAPGELEACLTLARRRLSRLTTRERSVLGAVFTLDAVAEEDEAGKVVLHAAVAHQMRWNTAHQNVSRAWRKLCDHGLGAFGVDWRAAHRFVCDPPGIELWKAARGYLDACSGRGVHGGPAFVEWSDAHEQHNAAFNEWKRCSQGATQAWRALADTLDRGLLQPRQVVGPLVAACAALGLDRWVVPAKLPQQSWSALLADAPRPTPEARDAWRAFLWAHPFGADVEIAFCELGTEAARADASGAEVARAYHRLLAAAERRTSEGVRAKDEFRCLLDAARWS